MNLLETIPVCSTVVHNSNSHSLSLQVRALPGPVEVFASGFLHNSLSMSGMASGLLTLRWLVA